MAKNGPTSLPLGLMTPTVAATSSRRKSSVDRNTAPASAIRTAPRISIHLRPMRSAFVVIHSDTATSPSIVMESSRPMRSAVRPNSER